MFLAKYLDQKQGEARVVDQQQVLSARLDQWLKVRPSASDLSDRGILGCGHRYKEARDIVDSFLQSRLQRLEEELAQIPAGNEIYPDRVLEILDGCQIDDANPVKSSMRELSYDDLQSQEAARSSVVQRLAVAGETWKHAASDCRRVVCTLSLRETSNSAHEALSVLETQRTSANSSLADVFSQLESCERLTARHRGLEAIVAMTEKTDAIRDAVFACDSDALPLSVLEGLPEMCSRLPSSSRAVGSQRALFLVSQIRTVLVQDLRRALKSAHWPADGVKPEASLVTRVVKLGVDLNRVQHVQRGFRSDSDACWVCEVLSEPLVEKFRYHFWRPDSKLCRMDKPEWAFKYLIEVLTDHHALIEKWWGEEGALRTLSADLALVIAREACLFVRSRMPALAPARDYFLHTLRHLIRFHSDVAALGGAPAQAAAFEDFDTNRILEPVESEGLGGAIGATTCDKDPLRFLRLKESKREVGFLDVWVETDTEFICGKLSSGTAWEPRGGEPEVAEIATTLADIFTKACERGECLTSGRKKYSAVFDAGVRQVVEAVKGRWNAMDDPLQDARQASLLIETLEEMCRFLDHFTFVVVTDEAHTLRLSMLERMSFLLVELVRTASRRMQSELSVFAVVHPLMRGLSGHLRPSNFLVVVQKFADDIAHMLFALVLRQGSFTRDGVEAFVSNIEDLQSVLASSLDENVEVLQSLRDVCSLVSLPHLEAAEMLSALRQISKCAPVSALRASSMDDAGEVLRRRREEIFSSAGVRDISVADAIAVLGKRPEFQDGFASLVSNTLL